MIRLVPGYMKCQCLREPENVAHISLTTHLQSRGLSDLSTLLSAANLIENSGFLCEVQCI